MSCCCPGLRWRQEGEEVAHLEVGGSHDNDAFIGLKAIHLSQQLVQRFAGVVFPLLAAASDSVDLIDEDDAGCLLLGGCKQAAHPAGAHSHKHLLKLTACPAHNFSAFFGSVRAKKEQCLYVNKNVADVLFPFSQPVV